MIEQILSNTDERYTPPEVMLSLERLFGKMFDPCPQNYTIDGLTRDWSACKCFVNPPYSNIRAWAEKAVEEMHKGAFVAFLIPNDCSTDAFKTLRTWSWGRWEIPFRVKFFTPIAGERKDVARSHVVFFMGGLR